MLIHSCYLLVFIIRSWLPSIFQKWPNEFSFPLSWQTCDLICAARILSEAEAIISLTSGNLSKLATKSYWHDPDFNDCVAIWLDPSSILYISYPRCRINHFLKDLWFFKWGMVFRDEGLLKSIVERHSIVLSHQVDSVMSNSATRLLCPWDSPGKNTGLGSCAVLQGIFPTWGSNPHLLRPLHWQVVSLPLTQPGHLMGPFEVGNSYLWVGHFLVFLFDPLFSFSIFSVFHLFHIDLGLDFIASSSDFF